MFLAVETLKNWKGHAVEKVSTQQRCKPYNEHRDMLKPDEDDLNLPNVEVKRGRHLHLSPNVNGPSEREHLLKTYLVDYEFCSR